MPRTMKRMSWSERAWWVVFLLAAITVAPVWSEVRPNFSTVVGGGGVPNDDSVTAAKMADGDHGPFTYSSNVATMDDDGLTVEKMSNGSWGLFTITGNVAALTNGDLGDVTAAGGVLGIDTGAVVSGDILDGTISANDMNRWAPILLDMCPPGTNAVANICVTLTSQGAGPSSLGAGTTMQWDTVAYKSFRLYALMGATGATSTDLILRCDTTVNMSTTPTTMVTIQESSLVANTVASSAWTDFTADECFANDVYFNIAAINGNGSESPVIRRAYVALR